MVAASSDGREEGSICANSWIACAVGSRAAEVESREIFVCREEQRCASQRAWVCV